MIGKRLLRHSLKSDPHISSKIHVSKQTYGSLSDMMGQRDFSWNETSQMIVVSDNVFESYLKVDPNVKTMRFKPFPYFPIWCEILENENGVSHINSS
ncbi:UNVERIFIED_CONTAM: hypothetical protein Scaly_2912600 [Sesamum calycinum]|uniref:Myb/SANT-like domain-containing protein n=1 Tax=Sesamum calycinum TaxID=2727403 RepID=A0AAW2L330_9LAMI